MKITRKKIIRLIKESLEELDTSPPVCAPGDEFNHETGEPCDPNEVDAVDSPIQDFIDADSEKQEEILQQLESTYDLPFTNRDIRMLIFSYVDKFDAFSKDESKISDLSLLNKRVQAYIETIERKYMDLSVVFLSRSTRLDTGLSMFYYNTPDIGKSFHTLLMSRVSSLPGYTERGIGFRIMKTYIRAGLFVPEGGDFASRPDKLSIKDFRKQVTYNTKVNSFKLIKAAQTTGLTELYHSENKTRHERILQIFDNLKKANTALGAEVDKEYGLSEVGSDIASEELSYKLENLYDLAQATGVLPYNPANFPYKEFEELDALITAQNYVAASKFCRRLARAVEDKIAAVQSATSSERQPRKDALKNGILEFGKELRTYAYPFEIKIKRLLTTLRSNVEGFQSLFENRRRRNRYRL